MLSTCAVACLEVQATQKRRIIQAERNGFDGSLHSGAFLKAPDVALKTD
jgi:hypothetical protein